MVHDAVPGAIYGTETADTYRQVPENKGFSHCVWEGVGGLRGDCCPCLHEVHFEVLFVFAGAAAPRSPVLLCRLIAWGAGGAGPEERRDEDGARGHAPGTVMGNAPDLGLVGKDLRLQLGIGFWAQIGGGGARYGVGMGAARRCA
jgi:hypothetical protein